MSQNASINVRKLHRKTAPIILLPLLLTVLTGVIYRLGRSWFGMSADVGEIFMGLHEGKFLGKGLVPFYVLLVGLGLIGMIVTGLSILKFQRKPSKAFPKTEVRGFHRFVAPLAFLPLLASAVTGIAYRLGRAWFGLSKEQGAVLLKIHQGAYLGSTLKPIYVLLLGVSLVSLLVTGFQMTSLLRKAKA
jgi:hypothetical protein